MSEGNKPAPQFRLGNITATGWFLQILPMPKQTGQFLSILTNCPVFEMVRIYPRPLILSTQTEQGFAFGRRLLGLPRFRENPAAGQFQEYVSLTRRRWLIRPAEQYVFHTGDADL